MTESLQFLGSETPKTPLLPPSPREERLNALVDSTLVTIDEPEMLTPTLTFELVAKKISLSLIEHSTPFFSFNIFGSALSLNQDSIGSLSLKASLSGMEAILSETSEWSPNWSKLVETTEDFLILDLRLYPQAPNHPTPLISIQAEIGSLSLLVVQPAIMRVVDNLLGLIPAVSFEGDSDTTVAALPLINIDVTMEPPTILIPVSPSSEGHLAVEIGRLSVTNQFLSRGSESLVNNLVIQAQRLSLTINDSTSAPVNLLSLGALSFGLEMPHSIDDGQAPPAIHGSLMIPAVKVDLRFDQIAFIMQALTQNLLLPVETFPKLQQPAASTSKKGSSIALMFSLGELELLLEESFKLSLVKVATQLSVGNETSVAVSMSHFCFSDESCGVSTKIADIPQPVEVNLNISEGETLCNLSVTEVKVYLESTVMISLLKFSTKVLAQIPEQTSLAPSPKQSSFVSGPSTEITEPHMTAKPSVKLNISCGSVCVALQEGQQQVLSLYLDTFSFGLLTWENKTLWLDCHLQGIVCRIEGCPEWQANPRWANILSAGGSGDNKAVSFKFRDFPGYDETGAALKVIEADVSTLKVSLVCKALSLAVSSLQRVMETITAESQRPTEASPNQTYDYLQLRVSAGVSLEIPEKPQSLSNLNLSCGLKLVSDTVYSGVGFSNKFVVQAHDLGLAILYKPYNSENYSTQKMLDLSQIQFDFSIPAGKFDQTPVMNGRAHISSIQAIVPGEIFSNLLDIYSGNVSELIETVMMGSKTQSPTAAPPPPANIEFSLGELFVGVLYKEGSLGCGLRNLSCKLAVGEITELNASIKCIFAQYRTEAVPSQARWTTVLNKSTSSCSLHECDVSLAIKDGQLQRLNSALSNLTITYEDNQQTTTILTLRDSLVGSRITVSISSTPCTSVASGQQLDCLIDFMGLGFLWTIDKMMVGKLVILATQFLAFTKKIAETATPVLPLAEAPLETATPSIPTGDNQQWDLKEPSKIPFFWCTNLVRSF